MNEPIEVNLPFRWDLVTPAQLRSLLAGTPEPDLWFRDALVECAGRVLARCRGGDWATSGEPALAQPWLRSLVLKLNRST